MKKILIINIILIILIYLLPNKSATEPTIETAETVIEPIAETLLAEPTTIETPVAEPVAETTPVVETPVETPVEDKTLTGYRITSYYPSESSNTTGSGKTTNDFSFIDVGGKKVYSYQGKIVVAGATNELLKSGYSINRLSKQTK